MIESAAAKSLAAIRKPFSSFDRIGAGCVRLRPLSPDDDALVYSELLGNLRIWDHLPEPFPTEFTVDTARALLEVSGIGVRPDTQAIEVGDQPIGQCLLRFDRPFAGARAVAVAYWLGEERWGGRWMSRVPPTFTRRSSCQHSVDAVYAWIPEPAMWAQWDWGTGPQVAGRATVLFCAWLAWSRFRIVIPCSDRTMPTLIGCLDRSMRAFGGAPTYWLTDNERTVTIDHVAGVAVRHPEMVAIGGHYGITIATCVPADPESKGGSESTVKLAKADVVPTDANLHDGYESWAELVDACEAWMAEVNSREHRVTRRAPVEMLAEEQQRLHRLPDRPYTTVFGETRKVSWSATISYGGVTYSVPHTLADETVWVRVDGDQVVVVHCPASGPVEVARHRRSTPGHPMIDDAHYPPRPAGPLARQPRPRAPLRPSSWPWVKEHGCGSSRPPRPTPAAPR